MKRGLGCSESSRADGLQPFSGSFIGVGVEVIEYDREPPVRILFDHRVQKGQEVLAGAPFTHVSDIFQCQYPSWLIACGSHVAHIRWSNCVV